MDSAADSLQAISDWLVEQGLMENDVPQLVAGLCPRLVAAGLPVKRCVVAMRVLHPNYAAETVTWTPDAGVAHDRVHVNMTENNPDYFVSPIRVAVENPESPLRRRLTGPDAELDFPMLKGLAEAGGTDYYVRVVAFQTFGPPGELQGMVTTWTSDAPDGFSDDDIAAIDHLARRLAVVVKGAIAHQIGRDALVTYLGADAGVRVLEGEIHRGDARTIRAVLLYADLRGFTALADRLPREDLVAMLGDYFDALVAPVQARGGQVLKFMGDGLLATFDLAGAEPSARCSDALAAAQEALERVVAINAERVPAGKAATEMDVVLHMGDVMYGNVGSESRLDFTVIGPAVNEAARIEALCGTLETHLVVSEAVADALSEVERDRLHSLGAHALRGVPSPRRLYTVHGR